MSEPRAGKIVQYVRRIRSIFVGFISGQVLEAFILGSMVFAGMVIFRFPHALSIGAILILATDGLGKALGFVVLIIVIQQIEGNLVYPKVMGKRVGLPSLWVLVAITLGSGVAGGHVAVRADLCHRPSAAPRCDPFPQDAAKRASFGRVKHSQ